MDYSRLFAALVTATKKTESEKQTPLCLAGIFFNTAKDDFFGTVLDAEEVCGKYGYICDADDLKQFLTAKEARAIFEALKADILLGFFEAYPDARK